MKLRTEIAITPSSRKIDQDQKVFSIGSCFASEMAGRLQKIGIATTCNPLGVLYNPLSIAETLERVAECRLVEQEELHRRDDVWFSYHTHGDFDGVDAKGVVEAINGAIGKAHSALVEAEWIVVTLGTAWVYERNGEVVANCHKMPSSEFVRRRLSVAEVSSALRSIVERFADKHIILTVSPIRHLADGLEGNSLSKALLRVAADDVVATYERVSYFPAYEILLDDLRDYRFYAADMTHPSEVAVEYVWERFAECYFGPQVASWGERFRQLHDALSHRPLHPESEQWRAFCESMRTKAERLAEELPTNDVARSLVELWGQKV